MEYHIVATLGPTSETEAIWESMLAAGVSAFRLNTSHLSLSDLERWLGRIQNFFRSHGSEVPVVLDLQGSKWRLGTFQPRLLFKGQRLELVHADALEREDILPVPHADFFVAACQSKAEIVLNDARVRLHLEAASRERVKTVVIQAGPVSSGKGITFSTSEYRIETLNEKDRLILETTQALDFVRYAISYVKDAEEMTRYRAWAGDGSYLIAKLERQPAINEARGIAASADEVWLCRGDLGAELGMSAMAEVVYSLLDEPRLTEIPTLLAGQVLEHMSTAPVATRAEICNLYDTLARGYQGVVLSDETAIGSYPLEACRTAALFRNSSHKQLDGKTFRLG
jgi:pyruvate kinase